MKKLINSKVDTPDGKATLCELYVTELGFLMAKIYYPKNKNWVNHKIGDLQNLLSSANVSFTTELMRKIDIPVKKELV